MINKNKFNFYKNKINTNKNKFKIQSKYYKKSLKRKNQHQISYFKILKLIYKIKLINIIL